MDESFYNILGVNDKANKDEIKKAYRALQMKFHPDKNPGNQEALDMAKKINEAYETLSDEHKREEYDRAKANPFMRMNSMGPGTMDNDLNDILHMMFGGGGGPPPFGFQGMPGMPPGAKFHVFHGGQMHNIHQAMQKPPPIVKTITINMEQVLTGAKIPLDIERWIIENSIKVFENETIYVTIPQGIDDGEMLILRDKGNSLNENVKGDIKIFVKVNNDSIFKRVGLDLIIEKNISLKESLCGFSFEIKYVNGKSYTLNNNKGNIIPPEYKKIYPSMGLQREEHKGNMVIHFHVEFPEQLTSEQIDKLVEVL